MAYNDYCLVLCQRKPQAVSVPLRQLREMARKGLALKENAGFGDFDSVVARCGLTISH
jgi:hypothetical protein